MVSSNDFKTGMTILYEGKIYKILEFMHVKPGKGSAFVTSKLRDLRSGAIVNITFNAGIKIEKAMIEKIQMQYLYDTGDALCFMDNETYEQVEIAHSLVEEEMKYLKENENVHLEKYGDEILGIILPDKVTLKVTQCDPAVKGDTKTNALKDAYVETGLLVKVPMFIEEGDEIIVSTETAKYSSRA
ncbi:MAG: elongation factor P [Acholeplasmatales bacterium]|nr:elongation factor P [Acholeplasmatales bacterium]